MSDVILETRNLRREFGALVAVDDMSMSIEAGSLHSIIGPNGAGKTTFFNLVSGTLRPTSGQVFFKGEDITELPMHRTIHRGIGRSFQITNLFPNLTVTENVRLAAQAMGRDSLRLFRSHTRFEHYLERAAEVLEQVGLTGRALQLAGTLPHGDQRKLELGMILAPDPEVLMLDEPTAGMASEQVPELMQLIQTIQDAGDKTVVLVEHNMNVVMSVSDRITVMHQGALLAEGTPAEIASDERVQTAYLGQLYDEHGRFAMSLLRLTDIETFIGQYHILQGVSLEVPEGDIVALLGRNGAGKTTTLKTILGSDAGPERARSSSRIRTSLIAVASTSPTWASVTCRNTGRSSPSLSVEENLRIAERNRGDLAAKEELIFGLFPDLKTAHPAPRHQPLGRSAADAGCRPGPGSGQPAPADR